MSHPGIRIDDRSKSARLPLPQAILLQEAFQGAAARSAIKPNSDFINWFPNRRLKDEEQLLRKVLVGNRDKSRI